MAQRASLTDRFAELDLAHSGSIAPAAFASIAERERASVRYWAATSPGRDQRMWWRGQTVRHTFHVVPGETILDLGCGRGGLAWILAVITRGECPITAATFLSSRTGAASDVEEPVAERVELVRLHEFPGALEGRQFDYIVASCLLDSKHGPALLDQVKKLLRPGGRLLFFETNPWNPMFQMHRLLSRFLPFLRRGDECALPSCTRLYELLSEVGFVSVTATCYDFLYWPIPTWLMRIARNLSLIMENTPGLRLWAGSILVHAQRPPQNLRRPEAKMVEHEALHRAVSVVIPCHNEEMNILPLIDGLIRHYDDYIQEFILVDDNSRDRTRLVLEWLARQDPRVRPIFRASPNGVGRALRDGFERATGKYLLTMDCDFVHILPELREMFDAALEGNDVVLGSRFSRESVLINYPLLKIVCNRSFHLLMMVLFRRRLLDVTNNLKLLSREVVDNLEIEAPWFAANAETGLKPLLMGFKSRLVPISWINRTPEMGQSSFSLLKNGVGYIKVLGALAWQTRLGTRLLPRKHPGRRPVAARGAALSPVTAETHANRSSP
jgi:dolichol-phosphate mannosyltransferase